MKKNNLIFLFFMGVFASCTQNAPEALLSKWENKVSEESSFQRMLASSSLNEKECFRDIFDVTNLKKEVADLEKKFLGAKKVTGVWKHLDLSKLPVPQANFLKTYGTQIGDLKDPKSIDYASCEDVPCIYNKIYSKEKSVAGYVHYLWYLRFGHMLSADNLVPDQLSVTAGTYQGKEFPLSSYLYNDKELFGLWRLSHMLKAPLTNLTDLKEIQRVPRDASIEGRNSNVCGLASNTGWILLNDGCLTIYNERMDTGYLYQAVTHEIVHQLDYQLVKNTFELHRSEKQDYLNLIGMFKEEYVNDKGETVIRWKQRPGAKLVSSYASTSPAENYAETIALFRVDGDLVKRKATSDHYEFVSREYFKNKNFESKSLMENWIEAYSVDIEQEAMRAVVDCSEAKSSKKSNYFSFNDFKNSASPQMINCLGTRSESIADILRKKAALYEPEGCSVLEGTENISLWNGYVKGSLKTLIARYLKQIEADKEYIARVQSFYTHMDKRTIPKEVYISCFNEDKQIECYQKELILRAKEQIASLNVTPEQEKDLVDLYVSVHPYLDVESEVNEGYKTFVMTHLEKIRYEADELWRGCKEIAHSDSETPKGSAFLISDGYMVSSFYNCLNSKIADSVRFAVQSFDVDGTKVQNQKEELLLSIQVEPHIVKMLKANFEIARSKELAEIEQFIKDEDGSIDQKIRSNFSWIKNVTDPAGIQKDCRAEALRLISFEPLYHIKNKIFSELVDGKVCGGITATPEYEKWITESEVVFKEMIVNDLDRMLYDAGLAQAKQCLEDYPITDSLSRIKFRTQRDGCLTANWFKVEKNVLNELTTNPLIKKFSFDLEDFKGELSKNARRTQLKIIKEKFN